MFSILLSFLITTNDINIFQSNNKLKFSPTVRFENDNLDDDVDNYFSFAIKFLTLFSSELQMLFFLQLIYIYIYMYKWIFHSDSLFILKGKNQVNVNDSFFPTYALCVNVTLSKITLTREFPSIERHLY